jgi:hypothetical protein
MKEMWISLFAEIETPFTYEQTEFILLILS